MIVHCTNTIIDWSCAVSPAAVMCSDQNLVIPANNIGRRCRQSHVSSSVKLEKTSTVRLTRTQTKGIFHETLQITIPAATLCFPEIERRTLETIQGSLLLLPHSDLDPSPFGLKTKPTEMRRSFRSVISCLNRTSEGLSAINTLPQ